MVLTQHRHPFLSLRLLAGTEIARRRSQESEYSAADSPQSEIEVTASIE